MTPPADAESFASECIGRARASLGKIRTRLNAWPPLRFHLVAATLSVAIALFFSAPKLWIFAQPAPGSFEWSRALTFLAQCRDPFAGALEPAMRWRILPPLVAHTLGWTGTSALLIPLIGIGGFMVAWSVFCLRWLGDRLDTALVLTVTATSAALLTPFHWLGINDGWYLLGLAAVAGGRGPASLLLPGLLAPLVDERFLFGLPLALNCRFWLSAPAHGWLRPTALALGSLVPYLLARGGWVFINGDPTSGSFVRTALEILPRYLSYGWIGWWHGLRAGWLLCAAALVGAWLSWGSRGLLATAAAALLGMGAITALAADLSRSVGLLVPLLLMGAVALRRARLSPTAVTFTLTSMAAFNSVTPLLLVTYTKIIPTWPLPVEIFRLLRPAG